MSSALDKVSKSSHRLANGFLRMLVFLELNLSVVSDSHNESSDTESNDESDEDSESYSDAETGPDSDCESKGLYKVHFCLTIVMYSCVFVASDLKQSGTKIV